MSKSTSVSMADLQKLSRLMMDTVTEHIETHGIESRSEYLKLAQTLLKDWQFNYDLKDEKKVERTNEQVAEALQMTPEQIAEFSA